MQFGAEQRFEHMQLELRTDWAWQAAGVCHLLWERSCLTVAMPHLLELCCSPRWSPSCVAGRKQHMSMDHHTCGTVGDAAWHPAPPLTLSLPSLHLSVPQCPNFLPLSPNNRKLPFSCCPTPRSAVSAMRTLFQGAAMLPVCEPDQARPAVSLGRTASGAWRCHGRPLKVAWDGVRLCRAGSQDFPVINLALVFSEGDLKPRNLRCLFSGGDRLTCSWEVKEVISTSVLFGLFFRATPASKYVLCPQQCVCASLMGLLPVPFP